MKKFMMIALVAIGFIVIATPESKRGRFNRHRVGIAGRFLRIPGLLLVWLLSVRRRLLSACYLLQQRVRALLLVARP
jgi:hypothetical protein